MQTDTTVGFLSLYDKKLNRIKKRDENKKLLSEVNTFKTLKSNTRIPNKFKKEIRLSKNKSYVYSNKNSFRVVVKSSHHYNFISKFKKMYSSSANITKENYDYKYAYDNSDVIVYTKNDFFQCNSSNIYKISNYKIKKIR